MMDISGRLYTSVLDVLHNMASHQPLQHLLDALPNQPQSLLSLLCALRKRNMMLLSMSAKKTTTVVSSQTIASGHELALKLAKRIVDLAVRCLLNTRAPAKICF